MELTQTDPNPLPCGCGIKGRPHIAMYGSNCELRQEYRNQFIDFCPLHSAAPELLALLENTEEYLSRLKSWMDEGAELFGTPPDSADLDVALQQIGAAILKARPQSSPGESSQVL